uniref:CLIP domain-containing serine protease n=1 Tax=Anopheles farauti TaxID=69004 RepID=A0A182QAF9_9DIPT
MRTLPRLLPAFVSCFLFVVLLLGSGFSAEQQPSFDGDFVFPAVKDLGVGDPCTVQSSPAVPYVRQGICQRVRDCATFVSRLITEKFNIQRDVCYFEVYEPVLCCVEMKQSAQQELDTTNLIY